jgi:hypothetical protein
MKTDSERVSFLFDLYAKYTNLLPTDARGPSRQKAKVS